MRVELELRYGGENLSIKSTDGYVIDAMYLKPDIAGEESPTNETGPTVVFCNPNAGIYEYALEMQDHWIEFYRSNGINILLWNYRGYGKSQGWPNTENILTDAETIVNYLRQNKNAIRIILHGESLGGAVATHVADKIGCDLLFADRTFSNLYSIAELRIGKFGAAFARKITGWHMETTEKFLKAQCYKVISSDPDDNIVGEIASLKNGISYIVSKENKIRGRAILTDNEIYVFYRNLVYLYEMVKDFNAATKKRAKKRRRKDKPKSQELATASGERIHTSSDGELEISLSSLENQPPIDENVPGILTSRENKPKTEFKMPEKYVKLLRIGDLDEYNAVLRLLNKVYCEVEKIEAAGSNIGRIMRSDKALQLRLMKGFLMNLDVWGSQPPAKLEAISKPLQTLLEARMRAYVFFKCLSYFCRVK